MGTYGYAAPEYVMTGKQVQILFPAFFFDTDICIPLNGWLELLIWFLNFLAMDMEGVIVFTYAHTKLLELARCEWTKHLVNFSDMA